jgi:hypothetical protein
MDDGIRSRLKFASEKSNAVARPEPPKAPSHASNNLVFNSPKKATPNNVNTKNYNLKKPLKTKRKWLVFLAVLLILAAIFLMLFVFNKRTQSKILTKDFPATFYRNLTLKIKNHL